MLLAEVIVSALTTPGPRLLSEAEKNTSTKRTSPLIVAWRHNCGRPPMIGEITAGRPSHMREMRTALASEVFTTGDEATPSLCSRDSS